MKIGNKEFDTAKHTYIMGILNVTPDSLSDGGKWNGYDAAMRHAEELLEGGTDILDIVDQYVNVFQHLWRSLAGFAVKRIYRQSGGGIFNVRHVVAGMYVATNPVLQTEEGNQIYVRCFMQNVNGGY